MSRIYSVEELEEEILNNNPNCYIPLSQLANLDDDLPKALQEEEEEEDDTDILAELRMKALFHKHNPRPEVPGELTKPESLFFDEEIRSLIEEVRVEGASRGVQTVVYNAAPPPKVPPRKQKPRGKTKPPRANEVIELGSSPECIEVVEQAKNFSKLVINPVAVSKEKKSTSGSSAGPSKSTKGRSSPLSEKNEPIVISSSNDEDPGEMGKSRRKLKTKKNKFFSPKELYEMKKAL